MRNERVARNIQAALARAKKPIVGGHSLRKTKTPSVDAAKVRCLVDALKDGERVYTVKEIATRHGICVTNVYGIFRGRLGYMKLGGKWVITETLYNQWLTDCVLTTT